MFMVHFKIKKYYTNILLVQSIDGSKIQPLSSSSKLKKKINNSTFIKFVSVYELTLMVYFKWYQANVVKFVDNFM